MKVDLKVKIDRSKLKSLEEFSKDTGIEIGLIIESLIYNAFCLPTSGDIEKEKVRDESIAESLIRAREEIISAIKEERL